MILNCLMILEILLQISILSIMKIMIKGLLCPLIVFHSFDTFLFLKVWTIFLNGHRSDTRVTTGPFAVVCGAKGAVSATAAKDRQLRTWWSAYWAWVMAAHEPRGAPLRRETSVNAAEQNWPQRLLQTCRTEGNLSSEGWPGQAWDPACLFQSVTSSPENPRANADSNDWWSYSILCAS